MNKSQVRLLAAEMANGQIPAGEYRTRRRELIDNIVAGTEAIVRVVPTWEKNNGVGDDDEQTTLNSRNKGETSALLTGATRALPRPMLLGAGAVLCVAILTVILWPESEAPVATIAPPTVPTAEQIPAARALVESFVARRNFGADAIASFSRDWQQIDVAERERASGELWFGSLVHALRNEVKTQKALAGLAGGDEALQRAQTAFALGEFLGISDKLPRVDNMAMPSTAAAPETPATTALPNDPSATLPTDATHESASAPMPAPSAAASSGATLTGRQWLAAQSDEQLTLQIFAVNNLDRVEQLITVHPTLVVHVLATEGAVPRYRVFHGVFADEASARQAYASLPADITTASHGAIVKSFSVVRDDLRAQAATPTPAAAAAQTTADDVFTLQVFATGNRDSAQALVQAFPALNLQLREMSGDAAPYRVVYGDFSSADDAHAAASTLPQALLGRIGTPLPKPISSLGILAN